MRCTHFPPCEGGVDRSARSAAGRGGLGQQSPTPESAASTHPCLSLFGRGMRRRNFLFLTPLTLFLFRSRCSPDGSGRERTVSRAYRNCQNHVQRLRGVDQAFTSLGSRGFVPGALRHLLPSCCSNPRRDWLCQTVRLCECEAGRSAMVKSRGVLGPVQRLAKIAAFRAGEGFSKVSRHSGASRNFPQSCGQTPASAGVTVMMKTLNPSQALSRMQYFFPTTACWLEARTGASSPFSCHGPPCRQGPIKSQPLP